MISKRTISIRDYFDSIAPERESWIRKGWYYHAQLAHLYTNLIPPDQDILEIGCGLGTLLSHIPARKKTGIDISPRLISYAKKNHPHIRFFVDDIQDLKTKPGVFDYIILSDTIGNLEDIQQAFLELNKVTDAHSRIIISYHNYLWEPIMWLTELLGLKMSQRRQNWLNSENIRNLLDLADLEVVKHDACILIPFYIPFISNVVNTYIAKLPLLNTFCLVRYFVARRRDSAYTDKDYSVSVVVPAKNEAGNIEELVLRTPQLGTRMEIIFVEGHSQDGTRTEIQRVIRKYTQVKDISCIEQKKGIGKADAIHLGFAKAKYDICIILDADMTVPPEDLPKFYHALRTGKGEYIQGSRLVYPLEKESMRFLNILGNKFFSLLLTWIIHQPISDTLCGTKAIMRSDYAEIMKQRAYFGNFDPFGDFELIFGASRLHLALKEIPIRYYPRTYGSTNISRFYHGWLLLKMTTFAVFKLLFV